MAGGNCTNHQLAEIFSKQEFREFLEQQEKRARSGSLRRTGMLLGMLTKDCQIKANIPSGDRSMFSHERYKFMLDAPFEISNKCCDVMKKKPLHKYQKTTGKQPITAQMASESRLRTQKWLQSGCNGFDLTNPISNPIGFWTEQDILLYIHLNNIKLASVYGDVIYENELPGQLNFSDLGIFEIERPFLQTTGCDRTGCFCCGFGCHYEKNAEQSRIQKTIDYSNPKLADWQLRGGHFNENGLWQPKGGLGLWFVYLWIRKHGGFPMWFPNEEYYIEKYSTPETREYLQ